MGDDDGIGLKVSTSRMRIMATVAYNERGDVYRSGMRLSTYAPFTCVR